METSLLPDIRSIISLSLSPCVSFVRDSLDKLKDYAFARRNRTWSLDFSVFWQSVDLISDGKGRTLPWWLNFCINPLSILFSTPNRWCFRDFRDAVQLLLMRRVFLTLLSSLLTFYKHLCWIPALPFSLACRLFISWGGFHLSFEGGEERKQAT